MTLTDPAARVIAEAATLATPHCTDTLALKFAPYVARRLREAGLMPTGSERLVQVPSIPFPGGATQAHFWREAADHIEGGYPVGGSNLTAAVIALLRATAEAVE